MDGKGESQWKKDGKVRREEMAKKGDFAGSWSTSNIYPIAYF